MSVETQSAMAPLRAVVGLGANLGDRTATFREALRMLREVARVERISRVYASPAVGPPQPDFLNAAALVAYGGAAVSLLHALLEIERRLGRVRDVRWGPRTIDLDVLWVDGVALAGDELTVPHPRLAERAFAVAPLLDVAPDARDPRTGEAYRVPPGEITVTDVRL